MLTEFLLPWLAMGLAQPVNPPVLSDADRLALRDCGVEILVPGDLQTDYVIIDASAMTGARALEQAIRAAPDQLPVIVFRGDFSGADMRPLAARLNGACFYGSDLTGTNWSGTQIAGLQLVTTNLSNVDAQGISWPGLRMVGGFLEGSDFTGASLPDLRFTSRGASFRDVSFRAADLTGASFACGITSDAWCINASPDLREANLTRADMSGLGLWDETLNAGARLDRTRVAPRSLPFLVEANVAGPLVLTTYYASPYGAGDPPPTAPISADEARVLIAASREAEAEDEGPSFDCALAATAVETLICGEYEYELRRLDRELAQVWATARAEGIGSLADQRRWLRERSSCTDRTCLEARYVARIAQLRGQLGPGITLAPDQSITYHSDILPLPDAMRSGALYERILPVLIDASYQHITLTAQEDGSIGAQGDAVGGNAHMCHLAVPDTRFDDATGWWSVSGGDGVLVPIFRVDGRRIVMRYSGNMGDTPVEARDFMTCGARAGFTDGIDLAPR